VCAPVECSVREKTLKSKGGCERDGKESGPSSGRRSGLGEKTGEMREEKKNQKNKSKEGGKHNPAMGVSAGGESVKT